MKRAFTLVELLVVVAIIMLLAAMLVPQLNIAKNMARATICRNNLHELSKGFRQSQITQSYPYPNPACWPIVPFNVLREQRVYLCPEDPLSNTATDGSQPIPGLFFQSQDGWQVPFCAGDHCRVQAGSGYTDFLFNDLWSEVDRTDHADAQIRVWTNVNPWMVQAVNPNWTPGYTGNCVVYNGDIKIQDCSYNWTTEFPLMGNGGSGWTNYGINGCLKGNIISPSTVVLLDYPQLIVNHDDANFSSLLENAAALRHRGMLNVLYADDSVRLTGPMDLEVRTYLWSPK